MANPSANETIYSMTIEEPADPNNVPTENLNLPPKFVGIGKDELLKYENDPFWVRLRWILFVVFWVVWLGMLGGAIIIIVNAPKAKDPVLFDGPTDGPYYQIYLNSFSESGKFDEVDTEVDYLQSLGIKSVIISQVLKTDDEATPNDLSRVIDFKDIDQRHGNLDSFARLVERFQEKAIKVILQLIPNHSSLKHAWFTSDEIRDKYYVIKDGMTAGGSTWQSQWGGRAWDPVPRDPLQSYLHQFQKEEGDFNYANSDVIHEMNQVLGFWYAKNISGFLLSDVSFLLEDLTKLNVDGANINHGGNFEIIQKLLDVTGWSLPEGSRMPYALLDLTSPTLNQSAEFYSSMINPVSTSLTDLLPEFNALDLHKILEDTYAKIPENHPVHWRLSSPRHDRPSSKFGANKADALALVTFLLQGQVILYYGDEYGIPAGASSGIDRSTEKFNLADAANERVEFYKNLTTLHVALKQPELGSGTSEYIVNKDKPGIFIMKRSVAKDLIVLVNFGDAEEVANIEDFRGDETTTVLLAVNLSDPKFGFGAEVNENEVTLPAHSGLVLELPVEK